MPKLVEDLVPRLISLGALQKILQNLLEEGSIFRDMRSIIESIADHATRSQNADDLTAQVRLSRSVGPSCSSSSRGRRMQVMTLDPGLERLLTQASREEAKTPVSGRGLPTPWCAKLPRRAQRQEQIGGVAVASRPGQPAHPFFHASCAPVPQLKRCWLINEVPGNTHHQSYL